MAKQRSGAVVALAALALAGTIAALGGVAAGQSGRVGAPAPELASGPWIGSDPLTMAGLRGRVVLLEFWTYG